MDKAALEKWEKLATENPSSTAFVDWALGLIEHGSAVKAIEVLKQGLARHPKLAEAYIALGKAYLANQDSRQACNRFDDAVALAPKEVSTYQAVIDALMAFELAKEALPFIKKVMALQPNNGLWRKKLAEAERTAELEKTGVFSATDLTLPAIDDPFGSVASSSNNHAANELERTVVFAPTSKENELLEQATTNPFDAVASTQGSSPKRAPTGEMTIAFDTLGLKNRLEETASTDSSELLADVPSLISSSPTLGADRFPSPPTLSEAELSVLNEVPTLDPRPSRSMAQAAVSTQTAQAIAQEYEHQLRRQLSERSAQRSFGQKYGIPLLAVSVFVVLLGVFVWVYWKTGAIHRGRDLSELMADAQKGIAMDTQASLLETVEASTQALQMEEDNLEAKAFLAYANALLFAEHAGNEANRKAALEILQDPQVQEAYPGWGMATTYYLASPPQRLKMKDEILKSTLSHSEVEELAGRILLADKKNDEAWKRLSHAVELKPGNVRALVSLGNYYLQHKDPENALKVLTGKAATLSKAHPERTLGAAEARWLLGSELEVSLEEVQAMPSDGLPLALAARRQLVLGRLLSAKGQHEKAIDTLREGANRFSERAFDFYMAWGRAAQAGGRMGEAQSAFNMAVTKRPDDEEALASLGRVYLARGRDKDAAQLLGASRQVSLVRGIAYLRLKEYKKAEAELHRTKEKDKYPPEAVVYLALADGLQNEPVKAMDMLEKVLASTKKPRPDALLALATLQQKQGDSKRAEEGFRLAAQDPLDYEANCSLGRLLLEKNLPELALEPLKLAVARNDSHNEAQQALLSVYEVIGRFNETLEPAKHWHEAQPQSIEAQTAYTLALFRNGRFEQAETASLQLVKLAPSSAQAFRLRSRVLFARGDSPRAMEALEKANKLNSKDAETFCDIGLAYMRSGGKTEANAAYSAAVREDPQSFCGSVGLVWTRLPASAANLSKELKERLKLASKAEEKAFAHSVLAETYLAMGSKQEALEQAQAALEVTPFSGFAYWAQAQAALKLKNDTLAKESLEKALAYEPVAAPVLLTYADTYSKSKDKQLWPKAVNAYETYLTVATSEAELNRVKKDLAQLKKRLE